MKGDFCTERGMDFLADKKIRLFLVTISITIGMHSPDEDLTYYLLIIYICYTVL